ncbi:MAG: methyltransferase [Deltaproteobacteria bacterium]
MSSVLEPPFDRSSRARLTLRVAGRFVTESLFDRLARAVCEASCLPRKELYESWEVARFTRRHVRGGRVVDLAAGHGLLAYALLLLDDSSPAALCVDTRKPASAGVLAATLESRWPRLAGRVAYHEGSLDDVTLGPDDLVVSSHPCGALTDRVLDRAMGARARVAVLPCCHDLAAGDAGGLEGWMHGGLAIDAVRALRLRAAGYRVRTHRIPDAITPMNRLLLGEPA